MKITDAHLKQIYAHAREAYPRECVGFLLGNPDNSGSDQTLRVVRGINLNAERNDRFDLDPKEFIRVEREAEAAGLEIIGFYHSHPDWPAIPSQTDIDFAWEGMFYLIVSVHEGAPLNTNVWRLADDGPKRFEGVAVEVVDENAL